MNKAITVFYLLLICLFGSACATSLVVNSTGDEPDKNTTDGVCETALNECTLRAAIMEANVSDDFSVITFENITEISPASALPRITASNTRINGEGAVTLNGYPNNLQGEYGLEIYGSSYNIIQGLTIKYFSRAIVINGSNDSASFNKIGLLASDPGDGTEGNVLIFNHSGIDIKGQGASDNTVAGNYIGTGTGGGVAEPNLTGISIANEAHHNLIGSISGSTVLEGGNLISGNSVVGINLSSDADHNHISGNYIGTTKGGNNALPNGEGLRMVSSSYNVIGIAPSGEGFPNLISGNTYDGIFLGASNHNIIAGNYIGTNKNGTAAIPNRNGVWFTDGSSSNIIGTNGDGTADAVEGNLISGNQSYGVNISHTNTIKNVIAGNYIGTNFDASTPIENYAGGITVSGDLNLIGTNGDGVSDSLEGNVISGNANVGVFLASFNCIVAGNYIGVDKTGMFAIGNYFDGIKINPDGNHNIIGTDGDGVADAAERNIISGNAVALIGSAGIDIDGDNNVVAGNYIGTDATGITGLGNLQDGVQLSTSASGNLIGTDGDGVSDNIEGNLISGNGRIGIWIYGGYVNTVAGNRIGTDISGTAAIPNMHAVNEGYGAVHLSGGASGNIIGTNSDGSNDSDEGNLISGNARRGIVIEGSTTHFNIVAGNKIGTDITGNSALGNAVGIEISDGAYLNQIGTDGDGNSDIAERNIISANGGPGIYVRGSQNQIAGNFIGTDYFGTVDLGNGTNGISIADTSTENTIGGSYQKANLIAFNGKDGIQVFGMNADKTLISYNSIHSNVESGIDLSDGQGTWFTPNDPGDTDLGPNDLMNFPQLNSALTIVTSVTISGQIVDGLPNTQFEIQFFSNSVCDSPGNHGEGKNYIGSSNQVTDGNGNVSFIATLPAIVPPGNFITSTATTDSKTSEFSACVEVQDAQTYSQELEDDRCGQFDQEEMSLVTFDVDPELLVLNLYVKNPSGYPGQIPDDPEERKYTAFLGETEARNCNFQGFADRLYCVFDIHKNVINTSQVLKMFVDICTPPFYINEKVSIFRKEPGCTIDLDESQCIAAGGTYTAGRPCDCP